MSSFVGRLADLLYPPRCAACGSGGAWLCDRCRAAVRPVPPPLCQRCGQTLLDSWGHGATAPSSPPPCRACAEAPLSIHAIRAAALFEGPARQAILKLKYGNLTAVAPTLAELLHHSYVEAGWAADLILPVPLHPRRERQRGYNQAAALARPLAAVLGIPWSAGALRRMRATADQIGQDVAGRRANVSAAFAVARPDNIAGRTVLLVDDVATTGCTLEACAQALLQSGAGRVLGLVVARRSLEEPDAPGKAHS